MSILIKGMEMPKSCCECPLTYYEDASCIFTGIVALSIGRQAACPLVEVPPHGRLIDADALAQDLEEDVEMISRVLDIGDLMGAVRDDQQFQKDCKQNCVWYLTESPTIIEAEVDE